MQHPLSWGTLESPYIYRLKNIFSFGTGSASYIWHKKEREIENGKDSDYPKYFCNGSKWKGYLSYPEWKDYPRSLEGAILSEDDLSLSKLQDSSLDNQKPISIIERKKERENKMEKSTNINGFINSLPRIVQKKIWRVNDADGTLVQCVSASDNRKMTAQRYINDKYPGRSLTLTFDRFGGMITIPN